MSKKYEYNKKWRLKHPLKRYAGKKRYYQKTMNALNSGAPWTTDEIKLVIEHKISDSELSSMLGRSVISIQKIRWKYKNLIALEEDKKDGDNQNGKA